MNIKKLALVNFKNYSEAAFEFSGAVNCLVGDNGSGKTNVLDAIYYLSFCKSYFNQVDGQNVLHGEPFFVVQAKVEKEGELDDLYCGVKKGQKKVFRRNDKEYSRLADHIGLYPAVIITPNDVDLIKEGSEVRRKFVDGVISQYNRRYLDDLLAYKRALVQRNNLLKYFAIERIFDKDSLEIWDDKLMELGTRIQSERHAFSERFAPVLSEFYGRLCGGVERAEVEYKTNFTEETYADLMDEYMEKDRVIQRTSIGIHKDDYVFKLNDFPLKKFGSQGQQKSYLIAVKLAQFQMIKESKGVTPWLLLDDVFDKIDDKRVAFLMQMVTDNNFGQIFITDTHSGRVPSLFEAANKEVKVFEIREGNVLENQ